MARHVAPPVGARFNALVVIGSAPPGRRGLLRVLCRCDCENERPVPVAALLSPRSRQSCGCLRRVKLSRITSERSFKHGHTNPQSKEYLAWRDMLNRCYRPRTPAFHRYGGRGITVCDRWRHDFAAFLADVGLATSPRHSIDRIDNDGNYEPGNCRWATRKEQMRNSAKARIVAIRGEAMPIIAWAERLGVSPEPIYQRLARGWSPEAAVFGRPSA